uniref:Uncharacterized protein n=1 Tax=Anguilla anguilla TaxID=7936 RepID=A0A0E9T0A9_ANGAN
MKLNGKCTLSIYFKVKISLGG